MDIVENYGMLNLMHKKLDVYKKTQLMVKEIYRLTEDLPKHELFGLTSQVRRAAVSVCSNIAEGAARFSNSEKKRFYEIARSSLVEIDAQIEICVNLCYLSSDKLFKFEGYMEDVFKMLSKMIRNLS